MRTFSLSLLCLLTLVGSLPARTLHVTPPRNRDVSPNLNFASPSRKTQSPTVTQRIARDSWMMSPKTYAQTVAAWVARLRLGASYNPGALAIPGMKKVTPANVGLTPIPQNADLGAAIAKLPFALVPECDRFGAAMIYENGDPERKVVGALAFFVNLSSPPQEGQWRLAALLPPKALQACALDDPAAREAALRQRLQTLTETLTQRMAQSPTPLTETDCDTFRDYAQKVLIEALQSRP